MALSADSRSRCNCLWTMECYMECGDLSPLQNVLLLPWRAARRPDFDWRQRAAGCRAATSRRTRKSPVGGTPSRVYTRHKGMEIYMDSRHPAARPTISTVLVESRNRHPDPADSLPPGIRMEMAFRLSMDAQKLLRAGLTAQGFSETQIRELLRSKRR